MQADNPTAQVSTRSVSRRPNKSAETDRKRPGNGGLTPRVRAAIDAQVYEGLTRSQAATKSGFTENAFYQALRKPAVLAYWNECLHTLRSGERARNVLRLREIRDAHNGTPAVQAVKALEDMCEVRQQVASVGGARSPGVVIVINPAARPANATDAEVIEINPLIQQQELPQEE